MGTALLLPLLLASACGSKKVDPTPGSDKAPASPASASAGVAAPSPEATQAPEPKEPKRAAPAAAKLGIRLKSAQVFHPYASSHVLPSATDETSFDTVSSYDSPSKFGVGVVVEVENQGDDLLSDVSLMGAVVFSGKRGQVTCELEAQKIGYDGPRFATLIPAKVGDGAGTAKWKTDADSELEGSFRPGERARLLARNDKCESLVLNDLDLQKVTGTLTVTARRRFGGAPVTELGDEAFDMTVDSHTIRVVDKKSGKVSVIGVAAAVDMDRREGDGAKLRRLRLYRPIVVGDADRVAGEPFTFEVDARAVALEGIKLPSGETGYVSGNLVIHAKDGAPVVEDLAKLGFSVDTFPKVDLPSQSAAVSVSAEELSAHVTSIALAHHGDDASIDKGKRRLTVKWAASIAAAKIEARMGDKAQGAQGERALKSERSRVVKLLSCDEIKLVTNKTTRSPANKSEASKACAILESSETTELVVTYDLDRYEVPIALAYTAAKNKTFSPIASTALVKFDAR